MTGFVLGGWGLVTWLVPNGEITMQTLTLLRSRGVAETPSFAQSVRLLVMHISQNLMGLMRTWWRRKRGG